MTSIGFNMYFTWKQNPHARELAALSASKRSLVADMVTPIALEFSEVSVTLTMTQADLKQGRSQGRALLDNAHGLCPPGTLTAIMGPSGAGKTTLLDLLAQRSARFSDWAGKVSVNGEPVSGLPCLLDLAGYVLQHDVLHQHQTIRETLRFAAHMLLPAHYSEDLRVQRVETVLATLGLVHVGDALVGGGEAVRGLSGGERRRVSIAIQLLKSPSLLFLDEPTSGLDSHVASKIIASLRALADGGRTVVCTIHQPSASLFEKFDRLVLLARGKTVFSGAREDAARFFASFGKPVPSNWTSAEWFIHVVDSEEADAPLVEQMAAGALREIASRPVQDLPHVLMCSTGGGGGGATAAPYQLSVFMQTHLLVRRAFVLTWRDPSSARFLAVQNLVFGVLMGSLFANLRSFQLHVVTTSNALAIILAIIGVVAVALGVALGFQEKLVFQRERADRMYSPLSHFASRMLVDLPINVVATMCLVFPVYFWVGFRGSGQSFLFFLLVCLAVIFVFDGVAFAAAFLAKDVNNAYAFGNFYIAVSVFFSGDLIPLYIMPPYYQWLYYVREV
jgi:ABC-type multidrug transport system ATPase subunit